MSHCHLIAYLVLLLVFSSSNLTGQGQTVPCDEVIQQLSPCLSYLDEQASSPSQYCCQGVKGIWNNFGNSQGNRQEVCQCLESMLPYVSGVDGFLVSTLPQQCGLNIKLPPITSSFNCSQIS